MLNFLDRFLREPFRKVLMRFLILTEKKNKKPVTSRHDTLLQMDIHIPPFLVAAGCVTSLILIFLFHFGWYGSTFVSTTLFVLLVLVFFVIYLQNEFPELVKDDEAMMLLGTLIVFFTTVIVSLKIWNFSFYLTPLAAASILAALLLHFRIAIILTLTLTLFFSIVNGFSLHAFVLGFFSGMAGAIVARSIQSHRDFIRAGISISVVGSLTQLVFGLWTHFSIPFLFSSILWIGLSGFISAILALGLLPFLESFFQRVTPMKLQELANFNQPLLKRLMVEAPGTYHHSLMMATIAESAANAIGGNALLCRVGAYYHDIGKLIKPEYFIENQGGIGFNPHGNIAPALSSLVVIQHVKEGVSLAKAAKLPQEIINFIPMHHGTSRIEYFYNQALEVAQEELRLSDKSMPETEVEEEHYRYPGPRPQTKETAILMLADSVEAASRTLEEPTHLRLKDLVERLVKKKVEDGQLSYTPLTLNDLTQVQEAFVKTLTSIYHSRIEYPEDPK